jgi:Alternative complex III, ActD subunit
MDNQGVLGVFSYLDLTINAVKKLKHEGFKNLRVFSPMHSHEIDEVVGEPESIVRFFTLFGAMLGTTCGIGFTVILSKSWPLFVSAKPIVSLPPYTVIMFEVTILIGALSTLLGLLINSRLRRNVPSTMYDPRFSEDKFGIMVACDKNNMQKVEEILNSQGADEVKFDGI